MLKLLEYVKLERPDVERTQQVMQQINDLPHQVNKIYHQLLSE